MSADWTEVKGRFETNVEKLEGIKNVLAEVLPKYFEKDEIDLKIKNGYVELDYGESWGRCGSFSKYLEKEFIKSYPDVKFEFYYLFYDPDGKGGEKLIYDGNRLKVEDIGVSYKGEDFIFGEPCPECGGKLRLCDDYCYCEDCSEEFYEDDLGLEEGTLSELYEEKVSDVDEEFDKLLEYKLIK